jgi:hypothetical protein
MASWADSASHQAQADLDELYDAASDLAARRISLAGNFQPFAFAVSIDGHVQAVQPSDPSGKVSEVSEQLATLWRDLAESKNDLRAVAVAVNVTLSEENRDGIQITVEHREGIAIGLIARYTVGANRIPQLETPSAYEEDPRIWIQER